jgi:glycosyltransferase involved in cell wall biosynthesis
MHKIGIKKEPVCPKVVYIYDLGHYVNNAFASTVATARSCSRFFGISPPPLLQIPVALIMQFKVPAADIYFLEGGACLAVGVFKKMLTGAKIVLRNGDPLFYTLHSLPPWKREVLKFMIKRIDGILSDSELSREMARLYTNVPNEIAYPYVNVESFLHVEPNLRSFNLFYLGVLNEFKGVDILLDAFEIVKKEFNNSTLYLCGKFLGSRKLETKIRKAEGVYALGFHPAPQEIMAKCSVYLNVARVEPFGINVLEAMCAGLIPIVSENVGAKEVVRELDPSLVVSLDPAEIAAKVAEVFEMPYPKKIRLSKKAKRLASRFTKEWSLKNFREKFWKVVGGYG